MKEKPILFNTEKVKAILDGKKTCTRQLIKRTPSNDDPCGYGFWKEFNKEDNNWYIKDYTHSATWWTLKEYIDKFSRYHVGDILYVRETWCFDSEQMYRYKATLSEDTEKIRKAFGVRWHPSIHMPKEAARIFLKVTNVRIERLHEITEEGAKAEGVCGLCYDAKTGEEKYDMTWFKLFWDSTVNKKDLDKYGWEINPFVWVIEFERIHKEENRE